MLRGLMLTLIVLITLAAGPAGGQPQGSAVGGSIAYTSASGERANIWLLNVDTGARSRLTHGGFRQELANWDPSGRRLVYMDMGSRIAAQTIAVLDTRTHRARVVARGGALEEAPAWSPDGRLIAWSRTLMPRGTQTTWPQIWVMTSSGRRPHPLTNTASSNGGPRWSRDGSRILFVRWRSANSSVRDIWVMRANGRAQRRLIPNATAPEYSPDGKRIAYSRLTGKVVDCCDVTDLYVATSTGAQPRLLVRNGGRPTWSADGRRMVFQRFEGKTIHLWVVNADGSGLRRLTGGRGREYAPAWRPGT